MAPLRISAAREARAEAATWLARLRADDRTPADEAAFRQWLAASAAHRDAFDRVTDIWERTGGAVAGMDPPEGAWSRRGTMMAGGALAIALSGVAGTRWLTAGETYATGRGEQRRITLSDGSVVLLDDDTRVDVSLGSRQRRIALAGGRAHFQVASDPSRPFIVAAQDRNVIAIGTAFDVDTIEQGLSVLLLEGKVAIGGANDAPGAMRMIRPGERFVARPGQAAIVDRPGIEKLIAWQDGRIVFDDETLEQAAAQMNRYGAKPLVIVSPALGRVAISGSYDRSDVEAFARSVSVLLGAPLSIEPERILLGGTA